MDDPNSSEKENFFQAFLKKEEKLFTALVWALVIILIKTFPSYMMVFLILIPVLLSFFDGSKMNYYKVSPQYLLKSLKWLFIVSIVIFPTAIFVNHYYQKLFFGMNYQPENYARWGQFVLAQFLFVAFPEEFFFRGYLLEKMTRWYSTKRKVFGVPFGNAHLFNSIVFALSHSLMAFQWWHAFIFFPSLVFCWLREKTGVIWASVAFHALSNIFSYWVWQHYY